MYNFIDVAEVQEGSFIPAEALKINGEFIENQIEGYRTLYVKGREALSPELDYFETGVRDGSIFKNKRYPARIITVGYQLIAADNEAFREAYNKLGSILNVNDAELIFNDELDKFYTGTPTNIDEVESGTNAVTGEIEITCLDPFKYSVIEYEAEADIVDNTILIDYQGTYKSYPILEADFYSENDVNEDGTAGELTGNGECGFVAFFTEDEQIVQLGDPEEPDVVNLPKSQTLISQEFKTTSAWNAYAQSLWLLNAGCVIPSDIQQSGALAIKAASWATNGAKDTSGTLLTATSKANVPVMNYKVTAKATNRTNNSVKINISITVALDKDSNYLGRGYSLQGSIYIGGKWHNVTLKTTSEYWKGKTGHTKNITVTIAGLTAMQTSITGIKFKATRPDGLGTAGTLSETSCKALTISQSASKTADTYYLMPSDYGTNASKWHGPTIIRTVPADTAGDVGATNFILSYMQKMCIGAASSATSQLGSFQVHCCDADGNSVVGVRIHKNKAGKKATITYYLKAAAVGSIEIDLSYNNKYFGNNSTAKNIKTVKTSKITKSGSQVTFELGGIVKKFTKSSIAEKVVTKVCFSFDQYAAKTPLEFNGLYYAKFVKVNSEKTKDIPNKFTTNDVVEADCSKGYIYLNGNLMQSLGALGNDWETFVLTPGLNQIGTAYSSWVEDDYKPTMKVRYREVFL